MPALGIVRFHRNQLARAVLLAFVFLFFLNQKSFAATDWTAIQTAMGASGVEMPGDVLRFDLVRAELSLSVNSQPQTVGAVGNGFVSFKPAGNGRMFVDGSLPAQETELAGLQTALGLDTRIHVSGIGDHFVLESPKLVFVEFEAQGDGSSLATSVAAALAKIGSPQLGVTVVPGTNSVFNPASILPPNFLKLFDEGFVEQLDLIFAFYLPRPDEHSISIGDVKAESGLGAGQTFYIQVPFSGGSNITLDVDFALRPEEVQSVEAVLQKGGFSITSQASRFLADNPNLQYVHASASGDGFTIGASLYSAIEIIQGSHRYH